MDNDDILNGPLSDDFEENLRMENELLRLKLQAELGGESHSSGDLDPMIENEFLKQVMAFENSYATSKRVKVAELLGGPDFKKAAELSDEQLSLELDRLFDLLDEKSIQVSFGGTYDDRTKYAFIVEELFEHETDDFTAAGMTTHFDYEEFHPNHKLDIENRAKEFLNDWFGRDISGNNWYFDDTFILPDRRALNKERVVEQLKRIFDSYKEFTGCDYKIMDIGFQLQEGGGGIGHAEGFVKYKAVLENNEQVDFRGPFKLYLSSTYGWWSIFHIVFPGFEY